MSNGGPLPPDLLRVLWHIVQLARTEHWGDITLTMQRGVIQHVRAMDQRLPGGLPDPPGWFGKRLEHGE